MTSEEARNLLGGYATGSLTDAERAALFEAALENQELFDEVGAEQILKEVLDQPGAKQRLLLALEPPKKHRAWLWAGAAATGAITIAIGIVVSQRSPNPPPQQIAQVLKAPEPANAPPPAVAAPAVPEPAPARRKAAPLPATVPVLPSPEPPAVPSAELKAENSAAAADQAQPAEPRAVQSAPRPAAAARSQFSAVQAVGGFAFSYSVQTDGILQIVPASSGYLSVSADGSVIYAAAFVNPPTIVRIPMPAGAMSAVIGFSREQGITGTPVPRTDASGTVTDQNPPNGRILIRLSLTPATR